MFDFGFTELMAIGVVALIVVGPERLPKVARTAGHLLGRLQRYVSDVKSDIQREIQLDDLKKLQKDVEQQARDLESSMRNQISGLETDLNKTVAEVKSEVTEGAALLNKTAVADDVGMVSPVKLAKPTDQPQLPLELEQERSLDQPGSKA